MRFMSFSAALLAVLSCSVLTGCENPTDPEAPQVDALSPSPSLAKVPVVGCVVSYGVVERIKGKKITYFGTDGDDNFFCLGATQPVTVYGNGGNDVIGGSNYDDVLSGGPGCDRILGRDGDDYIDLGPGDDNGPVEPWACWLGGGYGQAGDDHIVGGKGNDYMDGGEVVGNNVCEGGKGDDVYVNCNFINDPDIP